MASARVLVMQGDRKPLPNGDMPVTIKVIGVGGAGGNAINGMVSTTKNLQGVEFIAMVSAVHTLLVACDYTCMQQAAQHV